MTKRPRWVREATAILQEELDAFGLLLPEEMAMDHVEALTNKVASQMGISAGAAAKYLTREILKEHATTLAFELVEEQPGADLFDLEADVLVPAEDVVQLAVGLAELGRVRSSAGDVAGLDDTLTLLAVVTSFAIRQAPDGVNVPTAVLTRAARLLVTSAEMLESGEATSSAVDSHRLADGFRRHERSIREILGE